MAARPKYDSVVVGDYYISTGPRKFKEGNGRDMGAKRIVRVVAVTQIGNSAVVNYVVIVNEGSKKGITSNVYSINLKLFNAASTGYKKYEVLDIESAARKLHCLPEMLTDAVQNNNLFGFADGGRTYIPVDDLEAFRVKYAATKPLTPTTEPARRQIEPIRELPPTGLPPVVKLSHSDRFDIVEDISKRLSSDIASQIKQTVMGSVDDIALGIAQVMDYDKLAHLVADEVVRRFGRLGLKVINGEEEQPELFTNNSTGK